MDVARIFHLFQNGLTSSSSLHKFLFVLRLGSLSRRSRQDISNAKLLVGYRMNMADRTGGSSLSSFLSRPFSSDFQR